MPEQGKAVTLYDVARAAGVSYQTVSRVINNQPNVAGETRERVLRAIQELDYRPNKAAQSLTTRRSHMIQVVTFDLGFYLPVEAMLTTSRALGYETALTLAGDPGSDAEIDALFSRLAGRLIDGYVLINPHRHSDPNLLAQACRGVPFVQVGVGVGADTPSVVFDQRCGTRLALQHLYDLGHRNIAEITGWLASHDGHVRHQTYLAFMREHGLTPRSAEGDFTHAGGCQAVRRLLDTEAGPPLAPGSAAACSATTLLTGSGAPFTALFCANDKTAQGALRALREHGLQVPRDISVVGFDDMEGAGYLEPPLTTVRQDFALLGRQAVEYLAALIEQPGTPLNQQVLAPQLIVRQSTRRIG